ncbi:uncharacterized protein LOC144105455 [Amblyomma americanum]
MILTLALCLSVMAAAAAASPQKNNGNSVDLDIMEMVKVNETLVVYKRKHDNYAFFRCHSMNKTATIKETVYNYTLTARQAFATGTDYVTQKVQVTLLRLTEGKGYKATYTDLNGINYTLTLKEMETSGACFVIFAAKSDNKSGCELLVPLSKINHSIPEVCEKYYTKKCRQKSLTLRKHYCIYS